MLRNRLPVLAAGIVLGALPAAAAFFIDSNLAVSPATHANGGGCYAAPLVPGLLDMLTLVNPEWAPIDVAAHLPPLSDPITIHGTVQLAKINEGGDLPADHESDDQNTFIDVDPAEQTFVTVVGTVERPIAIGSQSTFDLRDGRTKITVMSQETAPADGTRLQVTGKIAEAHVGDADENRQFPHVLIEASRAPAP